MNIVTENSGVPAAVLIRALEPREGLSIMCVNRDCQHNGRAEIKWRDLCAGPAKLCQALGIDRSFDGVKLSQHDGAIRVEVGLQFGDDEIASSPRINIRGDAAAVQAHLRWYVAGNLCVSNNVKRVSKNSNPG